VARPAAARRRRRVTQLRSFAFVFASAMAHYRFMIAEIADALPFENPAKKELLELIGKEG
jgi:hypothetical protein